MRLSKRIVLVVVALMVIFGVVFRYLFDTPALEPPRLEGTFQSHGLDIGGLRRTFHYYVPGEPSPAAAVIIALHSSRGRWPANSPGHDIRSG